jgi:hypothetical protein
MKTMVGVFFALFSFIGMAQEVLSWNSEVQIANGTTYGYLRPRIVLTANDIPLVVFSDGSSQQVYAARWNGASFATPVSLLPQGMTAHTLTWTGPEVAAKGDTVVVVFKANPMDMGNVYAVRSTDGGISFSDTIRVDNYDAGVAWLPSVEIDELGNPSVIYMAHDSLWEHPRYVVSHSTNTGLSYQPAMEISSMIPDEACDCCPADYVIKGNREIMLYRNNENNVRDIYGVYSTDFGATYNSFLQLNQLNWVVTSCPSSGPQGIFRDTDLISVSMSRASGKTRVYITQTDAATTLGTTSDVMMTPPSNVNGSQNYPRISGNQDTLVVVWQESNPSNPDIYAAFTTTGNINDFLTTKMVVNQDVNGSQTNPDVLVKNGKVHVVFQDAITGSAIYKTGNFGTLALLDQDLTVIQVYPNPTTSSFVVEGIEHGKYQVRDLRGFVLQTGDIDHQQSIAIDHIPSGYYFVEIETTQGRINRTLLKL